MKGFHELIGHTITDIGQDGDGINFTLQNGTRCRLYHDQDCCESVSVESINGALCSVVGSPLVVATEEVDGTTPPPESSYAPESYTWTIYTLATEKSRVVIRWFGESNGYYPEDVRFVASCA